MLIIKKNIFLFLSFILDFLIISICLKFRKKDANKILSIKYKLMNNSENVLKDYGHLIKNISTKKSNINYQVVTLMQ